MGFPKRLIFSHISCSTNLQIHQAPIILPKPAFGGSWVYSGLKITLLNGETRSFPNPNHPDTGIEACYNLITLSAEAHWHWNNGLFALKPLEISDDKKKLTVQFFWQPQYSHGN